MARSTFFGGCLIALAAIAGCYTGSSLNSASVDPNVPADGGGSGNGGGLPCDVAQVLANNCASCHGSPPSGGALNTLVSYEDLAAASKADPSESVATLSVARMQDTKKPMPPSGALAADQIAVLQNWIEAGMPKGTCSGNGTSGISFDTPSVCTSNTFWTRGDRGSSLMHPGMACVDCHKNGGKEKDDDDKPIFSIAGTVYPTGHEPDDCNGVAAGGVQVVITDANGRTLTLPINAAGNFSSEKQVAKPYRAKVVSNGKAREMATPQTNGDCNACHTEAGAESAPGRIVTP